MISQKELIGLLPAGGKAARISPLPCSKEIYPVGFAPLSPGGEVRPRVVGHYLLEKMRLAGAKKAFVILREGKWDIPAYFGDGGMLDMSLAYLMMDLPFGVPFTLDQAYPFVSDALVAFGFPDILFKPDDAFARLLDRQTETGADLVLGLFPAHQPHKMDMVDLDENGKIRQIIIKPAQTHLRFTWIIAVWTPVFTHFIHEFVEKRKQNPLVNGGRPELFLGDVIQAALEEGLAVETVIFEAGNYLDIGTPEDLGKASRFS